MATARLRADWSRTASLLAQQHNQHSPKGAPPQSPRRFMPRGLLPPDDGPGMSLAALGAALGATHVEQPASAVRVTERTARIHAEIAAREQAAKGGTS